MTIRIFCFIAAFIIAGCGKSNDDLSGTEEISGKLYVQNLYDSVPKKIVTLHKVFLKEDISSTNFIFSTNSDTSGYFFFKYIYNRKYGIHAETRLNTSLDNNILFTADTSFLPNANLEFIMNPDFNKQNGLYITCTDDLIPGGSIPHDSIYVYTSKVLAESDTMSIAGVGASYSFVSRLDGTALKMNLPAGVGLYINSACTFGNKRLKSKLDFIQLNSTGLKTITLVMK